MKKLLIFLTSVLLAMSLTACGGNEKEPTDSGNQQQTASNEPTPTPEPEEKELSYGDTFTFDGFEITISDSIEWGVVENRFSDHNGSDVALVPVHVKNNSGETGKINMFNIKYFGSQGTELDVVSAYFDNCIDFAGDLRDGAEYDTYLTLLYDGDGDYYVVFENFTESVEAKLPITK